MVYTNLRKIKLKIQHDKKKNVNHGQKSKDEMKSALTDEKHLKRKRKRLTIDWFFRPEGD